MLQAEVQACGNTAEGGEDPWLKPSEGTACKTCNAASKNLVWE